MEHYIRSCKSIENILNLGAISWILVNDGSTIRISPDDIIRISSEVTNFQYFNLEQNMGKGYTTRHGVGHSNSHFVIYTDIDFPYIDRNMLSVWEGLQSGSDLVLATRDQNYYNQISTKRAWISRKFRSAVKLLFNIPTTDTQAGLKGLSQLGKEALMDTKINRYLFDLELVKLCAKRNLKITEIEATLKHNIELPGVSLKILSKEVVNLVRILIGI